VAIWLRGFVVVARWGLIAAALAACGSGSSYLTPSGSNTTLMAGWERKFTLEWNVEPDPGGAQRIRGYISSQYGQTASQVRVLAQALDPSGAVIAQRIAWVPSRVVGFGRSYVEIPNLPRADHYKVTVWDYTIIEGFGGGALR
jgi:hypothetical protein